MAFSFKKFWAGLNIVSKATSTSDTQGDLESLSTDGKLRYHNGTSNSPVVTEDHVATLINKTIDADNNTIVDLEVDNLKAGVLNTDLNAGAGTNLQIPSALAVQTYISSGAQTDIDDLVTLTGVPVNSTTLGTFSGAFIPDNSDIKEALQALETEAGTVFQDVADLVTLSGVAANSPDLGTFTGTTIPDASTNKAALQALETAVETKTTGPASAVDERIARFDGTTGKLLQSSVVSITDPGVVSGVTQLNVDNIRLDGNTVATTSGDLIVKGDPATAFASITLATYSADTSAAVSFPIYPSTGLTGANAAGSFLYGKQYIVQTPFTSVDSIGFSQGAGSPLAGQEITLVNASGATFVINNDVGASGKRILTTTGANITVAINEAVDLVYSSVVGKWIVKGHGIAAAADLATHIANPTGAHAGSAISNTPSGNLAAITVQAALNELQTDVDTRATSSALTAHISNATGAHAASAISNTPTGNLAATDQQAANNELQLDIDTRATLSDLSVHTSASTNVHGLSGGAAVVGTTSTQTLSNKSFSDAVALPELGATPSNPSAGFQKIYMKTDGKYYKLNSAGVETEVGSGTGGGGTGVSDPDSLLIQNFDTSVLGDFTQTGLTFNTVAPLHGAQSAQLIHQGAINQSFKQTFAVDRKFRGQLNELSLAIRSTASDGNVTLLVTDETNAVTIAASQSIQTSSIAVTATTAISTTITGISNSDLGLLSVGMAVSGAGIAANTVINSINTAAGSIVVSIAATAAATVSLRFSTLPIRRAFSFTIPSNCLSMSYTVTALPEANSPRTTVDDLVLKLASTALLSTSVVVPVMTEWLAYTPTYTGFGTVTGSEMEWRQVGGNVEVRGKFTSGTSTAVEARISLPNGYTSASASLIPSLQMIGSGSRNVANAEYIQVLIEPSVSYMTFSRQEATFAGLTKANGSGICASGNAVGFFASVPVLGLSATTTKTIPLTQSGVITDADSMIRLDTYLGYGSTATKIPRFTNLVQNIGSDILYQDSATNGASFTAQTSGVYSFSFAFNGATANRNGMGLSKNSTQLTTNLNVITAADRLTVTIQETPSGTYGGTATWTGYLIAGDVIRPHTEGSIPAATTTCHFTGTKQGSLKQVSINTNSKATIPTSELRFEGASARGAVATAIVKFDTMAKIRGDAFTVTNTVADGTFVTMLKAGKLDISYSLLATNGSFFLSKNQAVLTTTPTTSEFIAAQGDTNSNYSSAAVSIFVSAGDVIRVSSSSNPTANAANNVAFAFQEQQIQVSVSNTLPQFSESDSSVRVDTANGYGSTGTKIRRFSNVRDNIGTDVAYLDSATAGSSFTAMSSGIYHISYSDNPNAVGGFVGLSRNASSLTSSPNALATSEVLAISATSNTGGYVETVSWQGYLVAGDIIRGQTSGEAAATAASCNFTMSKVGKPNIASVDVTPFVIVPFEKASVGEIKAYAGSIDGEYFLPCDGTAVNRGTYSQLFAKIGITHGQGDGSTTFNIPDYRGRFLRGVAGGSTLDPDRASRTAMATGGNTGDNVGSVQSDAFQAHSHTVPTAQETNSGGNDHISSSTPGGTAYTNLSTSATSTGATSTETRPENAYVNYGIRFKSATDAVLTVPETFSSDTAALTYAGSGTYTPSTLTNAPVGTYITHTYAALGNAPTQTTTRPTQTDADMNTNGILLTGRAVSASSTAAAPCRFDIQIGKGLKGDKLLGFASTSKNDPIAYDYRPGSTTLAIQSGTDWGYDPDTGVYTINAATDGTALSTTRNVGVRPDTAAAAASGYFTLTASKNPALTGMNLNRVAARGVSTSGQVVVSSTITTVTYDAVKTFDTHGALNAATGVFTAPESGYYKVDASFLWLSNSWAASTYTDIYIYKNGTLGPSSRGTVYAAVNTNVFVNGSSVLFLAKGDTCDVRLWHIRGTNTALQADINWNYVSFIKVSI